MPRQRRSSTISRVCRSALILAPFTLDHHQVVADGAGELRQASSRIRHHTPFRSGRGVRSLLPCADARAVAGGSHRQNDQSCRSSCQRAQKALADGGTMVSAQLAMTGADPRLRVRPPRPRHRPALPAEAQRAPRRPGELRALARGAWASPPACTCSSSLPGRPRRRERSPSSPPVAAWRPGHLPSPRRPLRSPGPWSSAVARRPSPPTAARPERLSCSRLRPRRAALGHGLRMSLWWARRTSSARELMPSLPKMLCRW
jgi:hypothetical protein